MAGDVLDHLRSCVHVRRRRLQVWPVCDAGLMQQQHFDADLFALWVVGQVAAERMPNIQLLLRGQNFDRRGSDGVAECSDMKTAAEGIGSAGLIVGLAKGLLKQHLFAAGNQQRSTELAAASKRLRLRQPLRLGRGAGGGWCLPMHSARA